tara:strand:- start:5118 stop:5987 length:870 start_codon:yes stop_codon:yes gene_type:complete
MRKLKAKPPVGKTKRAKIILSGRAGVGKTYFALDFPSCYYIDVEGSAERDHYADKLAKAGGVYFGQDEGSQDYDTVIEEIVTLATVEHEYKTVVIDSFSKLYATAAGIAEEKVGSDFGRDKKEANRPTRRLIRWIDRLDMNVILICHQADQWGKDAKGEQSVIDSTFDGMKRLEYELDLWIEILKEGKSRKGRVRKSRLLGFVEGERFDLVYKDFAECYGKKLINADHQVTHQTATPEQASNLITLCRDAGIPTTTIEKWCEKAGVESAELLPPDVMNKCLEYAEGRLS